VGVNLGQDTQNKKITLKDIYSMAYGKSSEIIWDKTISPKFDLPLP